MNTQNLQQKKYYVIDSESKGNQSHHDPIKFLTKSIESSLCDYSNTYILVTGNIAVKRRNAANNVDIALGAITQVVFKNCASFEKCSTEIDGTLVDKVNFINIAMAMFSLIEYIGNYSDISGSLWSFKRELTNNEDMTNDDNPPLFKYKVSNIGNTENNGTKNGVKIAVPLKYLSYFCGSLEIPLINCKVELSLKWNESCVLTNSANANKPTFEITDAKLYVLIVTLSIENNAKLSKLLGETSKRFIYWNKYKIIDNRVVENLDNNEEKYIRELLDTSYQGAKELFVIAYDNIGGVNKVSIDFFKNIFFQELKQKITTSKLMEETFMSSQLMTRLSNATKSDKYQQDEVMIIQLVAY